MSLFLFQPFSNAIHLSNRFYSLEAIYRNLEANILFHGKVSRVIEEKLHA